MSDDLAAALALERRLLGGNITTLGCGCVAVVMQVNRYHAGWYQINWMVEKCEGHASNYQLLEGVNSLYMPGWRTDQGDYITKADFNRHVTMSEYIYGKDRHVPKGR